MLACANTACRLVLDFLCGQLLEGLHVDLLPAIGGVHVDILHDRNDTHPKLRVCVYIYIYTYPIYDRNFNIHIYIERERYI